MEELMPIFTLFIGVLLRVGVPVVLTLALILVFKYFDALWKRDAALRKSERPLLSTQVRNTGCWEVNGCSEEGRSRCPAYANPDIPCWQVFRNKNGQLKERCLGCGVFAHAPVPVGD